MKRFHQLHDRNVWAGIDELMIRVGGIGPAPRVGESVELRLAYFPAGLAEEDVVIGVGIKRRIEIDEIDTGIGELFRVPQPAKIVAEIQSVHRAR